MESNQEIRIRLKSFDHRMIDQAVREIVTAVKMTAAKMSGIIPLPRAILRVTVNRAPHADKKSREQFEIRTHKRLLIIKYSTPQTVEALEKVSLPAGIDVEIKLGSS